MRLPSVPGPRDVLAAGELLMGLVPRAGSLVDEAERVLGRVDDLLDRIEDTRTSADDVVRRTDATVARATTLLDALEPPLTALQPTLERLADTTDPREVDALVQLIDHLPLLVTQLERDVLPVLTTLGSVAPDLHDLLDVSRELNEMLAKLPGMGRLKKRVDEEQALEAAEEETVRER